MDPSPNRSLGLEADIRVRGRAKADVGLGRRSIDEK